MVHPREQKEKCQHEGKGGAWRQEDEYPLGVTVANSKGMKLREEGWLHSNDLCVQLCRPRHGGCARQEDHPLGNLKAKQPKMFSAQVGGTAIPMRDSLIQNIESATRSWRELDVPIPHPRNSKILKAAAAPSVFHVFHVPGSHCWLAVLDFTYLLF